MCPTFHVRGGVRARKGPRPGWVSGRAGSVLGRLHEAFPQSGRVVGACGIRSTGGCRPPALFSGGTGSGLRPRTGRNSREWAVRVERARSVPVPAADHAALRDEALGGFVGCVHGCTRLWHAECLRLGIWQVRSFTEVSLPPAHLVSGLVARDSFYFPSICSKGCGHNNSYRHLLV